MKKQKLCVDCKWHKTSYGVSECTRSSGKASLITGRVEFDYPYCSAERRYPKENAPERCGIEGSFFELKKTFLSRLGFRSHAIRQLKYELMDSEDKYSKCCESLRNSYGKIEALTKQLDQLLAKNLKAKK